MSNLWIFLSIVLALASVGVSGMISFIFLFIVFACGCLVVLFAMATSDKASRNIEDIRSRSRQGWTYPVIPKHRPKTVETWEKALTESEVIDEQLKQIMDLLLRDYIYSWHFQLTHTNEFSQHLKELFEVSISSLSESIRGVDWVAFLTTRFVHDLVNHVRLFKRARVTINNKLVDIDKDGVGPALLSGNEELESAFFDCEAESQLCHDIVARDHEQEITYLQDLSEIILFLLLPHSDFSSCSLRTLAREVLANSLLKPVLDLLTDPDFLNQNIVWLYKDTAISSMKPDLLFVTVRMSDSIEELHATRESVNKDIAILRSNDSKGESDSSLKHQLNSLLYLKKMIDGRIHRLKSGLAEIDSFNKDMPSSCGLVDHNQPIGPGLNLFSLPLEVVLKNNLALSYFIDFMTAIGCQGYVLFYLNIEGWKSLAEQQLELLGDTITKEKKETLIENLRESAQSIYEEYLAEKASPRLKLDDTVVKRLLFKIRTEPVDYEWFAEVQSAVCEKLLTDERFLDSFKRSVGYVKLLSELDLLRDLSKTEDDDGRSSTGDDYSIYDSVSLTSNEDADETLKAPDISRQVPESTSYKPQEKSHRRMGSDSFLFIKPTSHVKSVGEVHVQEPQFILTAEIVSFEVIRSVGNTYAIYKIAVEHRSKRNGAIEEKKVVLRRYSDFHQLHERVVAKYPDLSRLPFPRKKAFGNMGNNFLEQRMHLLNIYMKEVLRYDVLESHIGLLELVQNFLEDAGLALTQSETSNVAKAVGSVKNSVKTVSNVVTSVPAQLLDNVMDGINKVLPPQQSENNLPNLGIENDATQDNIPLRIALLFLDEVFDLREQNQWLRRQIVTVLRQILKAMFGDWANRQIVDYFSQLTAAGTISNYLSALKESMWPNGFPAADRPIRDEQTKMRTRMAAKMVLLSTLSEDLKRIIGSETSRTGLMMLFEMVQHPVLNKRLAVVLLESLLDTIFQGKDFPTIFTKLHANSPRRRNQLIISQRKKEDLRR